MENFTKQSIKQLVEMTLKEELNKKDTGQKAIVVANWKMHMTIKKATDFLSQLKVDFNKSNVVICPPYPLLYPMKMEKHKLNSKVNIGAQNMHWEDKGAYTSEVSASMLKDMGCQYVILGHSERRIIGETDEIVNEKVKQALDNHLTPIVCIGETEKDFNQKLTYSTIKKQIRIALKQVEDVSQVLFAYEPIWAIGTGKSASPEQAEKVLATIRQILGDLYKKQADEVLILYGGSVNEKNSKYFCAQKNIDGLLVGGASLNPQTFQQIIEAI